MFKVFIITLWIQYEGKLYTKYAMPLQSKCNQMLFWDIQEQYKNTPLSIVAMKCTKVKDFKLDKRIYNNELN
tara:strand:- start:179 stop:394 length:216 start_codon:yes stop_codon:yes gene_type:complete